MTFKNWLKKYVSYDTPHGDLARDIEDDSKFPNTNNYDEILKHLNNVGACYEAIRTFKRAYKSYLKAKEINKWE